MDIKHTDNDDITRSVVPGGWLQPTTTRKKRGRPRLDAMTSATTTPKKRSRRSGAIKRFGLQLAGKDGFGGDIVVDANGKRRRVSATTLDQLRHPRRAKTTKMMKTTTKTPAAVYDVKRTGDVADNAPELALRAQGWESVYRLEPDGKEWGRPVYRLVWDGVEPRNE